MDYSLITRQSIRSNAKEIKELGTWIYNHPESALKEHETCKHLMDFYKSKGFDVEGNLCGLDTAFRAIKKNGRGRRVCLMAEYDALPGIGHACGHHLIASMCASTALAIANALDNGLEGEVTVIGAPAEETGQGKPVLCDGGIYDGFDAAMSLHPYTSNISKPDWIAIGGVDFTFTGKASHAGTKPDEGINALDALFVFYASFSALRQQLRDGTRIHGIITEGGSAANIIPDLSRIRLEFRSNDQHYFETVVEKVINCAKGAALATGCELEYHHYEPTCKGVTHNSVLLAEYEEQLKKRDLPLSDDYMLGSTDVGNVSTIVPTIHPLFQVCVGDYSLHTPEFLEATIQDEAFEKSFIGSEIMTDILLKILIDDAFAKRTRAELER